jgi:hypothetical protein
VANLKTVLKDLSPEELQRLAQAKQLELQRTRKRKTLVRMRQKLTSLEREVRGLDRKIETILKKSGAPGKQRQRSPAGRARKRRSGKSLRQTLAEILRSLGRPAKAAELARMALRNGYRTESSPEIFLIAVCQELRRNEEFERGKDGSYRLRR